MNSKPLTLFRWGQTIRIWLLGGLCAFLLLGCSSHQTWANKKPPHYTADGFRNYPTIPEPPSLGFTFYWRRFLASLSAPEVPESHFLPESQSIEMLTAMARENTVTWIGQSTLLLRIDGTVILTDPFFSHMASPFIFGPERFIGPGISAENIPPINIILISHNHYDHLDEDFIESIPNKEQVRVIVPLKLGGFFSERGYTQVHEMDWHESVSIDNLQFTALPMVHYSGRGLSDRDRSLWCAWAVTGHSGQYFFAGDTAYSPTLFKEIGKKFGHFDLAMIPIGTYGNRKYGINNHINPEEAIKIGREINAETLLGIHWGTIDLSEENPWEPPERFRISAQAEAFPLERAWTMKIGETRKLPGKEF